MLPHNAVVVPTGETPPSREEQGPTWLRTPGLPPLGTTAIRHFKKGDDIWAPLIVLADVAVVVSSAKRSAEWWRKKLGFATHTVGRGGHAVLVAPPGDRFVLHLCEGIAALEPGDTGIAFLTDDMDATAARMKKGGVEFPVPPTTKGWGVMAKFADPDGNIFWLLEVPATLVRSTLALRAPKGRRPVRPRRGRSRRR